jgi:phosphoglycerate dehydrogenase-like enzyme
VAQAAFFSNDPKMLDTVYGNGIKEAIESELDFLPETVTRDTFAASVPTLSDLRFIFSTWGMPKLTKDEIAAMPHLEAVFYAAGSVRGFARPFLEQGITVVSAWAANAVPVAEYVLAQVLLAAKGYFRDERLCRTDGGRFERRSAYPGIMDVNVSLLGAGMISRKLMELLQHHRINILVVSRFMSDAEAAELGVRKVSIEDAFREGFVVSNHLANLPDTRKTLTADLFRSMQRDATFINTGRGATVDEQGMLEVLRERPDLTALLDVTDPEPPEKDSAIYELDNVILTPHIAGSIGRERLRMAEYAIEEFHRYSNGEPLRYAVTSERLETMA